MTRQRRHPAQASRIVAAGLSAATMLGIVAVLGASPSASPLVGSEIVGPPKVTVVVRVPGTGVASPRDQRQQAGNAPDTSTRPS